MSVWGEVLCAATAIAVMLAIVLFTAAESGHPWIGIGITAVVVAAIVTALRKYLIAQGQALPWD